MDRPRRPGRLAALAALAAAALAASLTGRAAAVEEAGLRAGAAAANINPPLGSSINGGMTDRTTEVIHDDLNARCLVLDDGRTRLALIVCDSCMIPREVVLDAKRAIEERSGIPPDHVLISATHAHSCPTCAPVFQSETVEGYPAFLAGRIAEAVAAAVDRLEPAELGVGVGRNDRQVFNRRWHMKPGTVPPGPFDGEPDLIKMNPPAGSPDLVEPAGPIDPAVSVVSARSRDGRPIALLANYSLHYVGGTGPGHVSADYYGAFADRVAALLGPGPDDRAFVAMMSNGTSGDINNINFRTKPERRAPYEQIQHVADELAAEAVRVARSIEHRSDLTLDAATTELSLGVRRPTEEDLSRAREILGAAGAPPYTGLREIYAREAVLLSEYPEHVPLTIQAMRIGDLGIAAIPCEVFVEIGLEIKAESPFPATFTIELANGYNGYLPTERHHGLGGYETWRARSSYLEVGAASAITDAALGLLRGLGEKDGTSR